MDYKKETKKLIFKLLHNNSYNYEDLTRFVQITRAIARSYLKNYYPSFLRLCAQHGMTEDDLAEDSILQIFARDDRGDFHILRNFTDSLDAPFDETSEDDVFKAFQAFVHTVSIRQLIKTYAEIDSTGAKLYRNIRDCTRKMDNISVTRDYRGLVLKPSNNSSHENLPAIPFRELEQRFTTEIRKPYTTPNLLSVLITILEEQNTYRRSLPFFDAVTLFKRHYSYISNNGIEKEKNIDLTALSTLDYRIMKDEVFEKIRLKIFTTYVVSGKINYDEANSLYQTVVDIVSGWFDRQKEDKTIYDYAHLNFGIDEEQYKRNWRTKIEYLVRIARNQIKMYLLEGL